MLEARGVTEGKPMAFGFYHLQRFGIVTASLMENAFF